jgi:hypothetical protein
VARCLPLYPIVEFCPVGVQARCSPFDRAAAATIVRSSLLAAHLRVAATKGPFPRWWVALHISLAITAVVSNLCYLSDHCSLEGHYKRAAVALLWFLVVSQVAPALLVVWHMRKDPLGTLFDAGIPSRHQRTFPRKRPPPGIAPKKFGLLKAGEPPSGACMNGSGKVRVAEAHSVHSIHSVCSECSPLPMRPCIHTRLDTLQCAASQRPFRLSLCCANECGPMKDTMVSDSCRGWASPPYPTAGIEYKVCCIADDARSCVMPMPDQGMCSSASCLEVPLTVPEDLDIATHELQACCFSGGGEWCRRHWPRDKQADHLVPARRLCKHNYRQSEAVSEGVTGKSAVELVHQTKRFGESALPPEAEGIAAVERRPAVIEKISQQHNQHLTALRDTIERQVKARGPALHKPAQDRSNHEGRGPWTSSPSLPLSPSERGLAENCQSPECRTHPGGHAVPRVRLTAKMDRGESQASAKVQDVHVKLPLAAGASDVRVHCVQHMESDVECPALVDALLARCVVSGHIRRSPECATGSLAWITGMDAWAKQN